MKVEIQAPQLPDVAEEIRATRDRAGDLLPATKAAAEALRTACLERFDTETAFDGEEWRGLDTYDPAYLKRRKPAKRNTQDRTLANSVHAEGEPDGIRFGANTPYAGARQSDMPYLPVDENGVFIDTPGTPGGELMDEIEATIADYILGEAER